MVDTLMVWVPSRWAQPLFAMALAGIFGVALGVRDPLENQVRLNQKVLLTADGHFVKSKKKKMTTTMQNEEEAPCADIQEQLEKRICELLETRRSERLIATENVLSSDQARVQAEATLTAAVTREQVASAALSLAHTNLTDAGVLFYTAVENRTNAANLVNEVVLHQANLTSLNEEYEAVQSSLTLCQNAASTSWPLTECIEGNTLLMSEITAKIAEIDTTIQDLEDSNTDSMVEKTVISGMQEEMEEKAKPKHDKQPA